MEALFLPCIIDALKKRDVATTEIPDVFIQSDMDETLNTKIQGKMAQLMTNIHPKKYAKYTVTEKGKPVIYVRLLKALYGYLKADLFFWKNLSETLQEWGFNINPYDWCVSNKMINGKQCTIEWHVKDSKISHIDSEVIDEILNKLDKRYRKEAPMFTTRGKVHYYLGMTMEYNIDRKVQMTMF